MTARNRLAVAYEQSGGAAVYGYDASNRRVWNQGGLFTLYGAQGEKLGVYAIYTCTTDCGGTNTNISVVSSNRWFGGHLIVDTYTGANSGTGGVFQDRLGTNRVSGARFYPYGEEITSPQTTNDREKFATYTRDSYTGLDYADQRFYASTYGRFNTPDPYRGSSSTQYPLSWNRYSYALGDPVDWNDPSGQCTLRGCLINGLHIVNGVVKVGFGVVVIGSAAAATVGSGGAAAALTGIAAVGGLGMVFSGVLDVAAGVTGNQTISNAATAVSNITNPAGALVTSIVAYETGDPGAGELAGSAASSLYGISTSTVTFLSALENGIPNATDSQALQVAVEPFVTGFDAAVTGTTTLLNNSWQSGGGGGGGGFDIYSGDIEEDQ
jgi:RHS repeat-associated protein